MLAEVDARLGRDLEGLRRQALGRELDDTALAVRVDPHLRATILRPKSGWLRLQLEHEDRPEHPRDRELEPVGSVGLVQGTLLGVDLAQGALAEHHLVELAGARAALQPPRAHEAAGDHVDLDAEAVEPPDVGVDLRGIERAQLDHRVADAPLDPARAHDDARPIEREVGRVEEHDLADLGIERVEPERADRGSLLGGGHGELELDRVRALQQAHHLGELLVAQAGASGRPGGHVDPFVWGPLVGLERAPPADEDAVHAGGADDGLGGQLEVRGVQDERAGLWAADAAVEADQLLEGAALFELGVVEAADHDVGDVLEAVGAQQVRAARWARTARAGPRPRRGRR